MALPLSGLKDQELLKVETDEVTVLIKGKPLHPTVEELDLHKDLEGEWVQASLKIVSYKGEYRAYAFNPFTEGDQGYLKEYHSDTPSFPCFYENHTYNIQIQGKEGTKISFYHDNKYLREAVARSLNENMLVGNLNFSSDIGFSELVIRNHNQDILKIQIEVFPTKIDYKKDYQALLREVTEEIYNLAFDHLRRTYSSTQIKTNNKASLTEFFSIVSLIFERFIKALEPVNRNPHHKILAFENISPIEKIKRFDIHSAKWIAKRPNLLVQQKRASGIKVGNEYYHPEKMRERKKVLSYDTFENRFVKWVIQKVINRLKNFQREYQKAYSKDSSRFDQEVDKKLDRMQQGLQKELRSGFLQEVKELNHLNNLSLVLQMAPGYRDVYKYYLMLTKGLSIQSDVFKISVKQLWELYEYWCFLALNKLLKKKYNLISHDLIKVTNNGLIVKLKQDRTTTLKYENPFNGERFELSYQDFNRGPTLSQEPDNMLTLYKSDSGIAYKYVLDAKYRVNPAHDKAYKNKYGKPGPEEGDINTMHRYRDAIVYGSKGKEGFEKVVYGAFVLFPYGNAKEYSGEYDGKPHKFYESIKKINIGGIPFLPGNTELVEKFLDELILESEETAVEKALIHEGAENYYYEKFQRKNVLVGSLKSKEQWEINYKNKFYHIPLLKVAPVLGNLEYVAIYKSKKNFSQETSGILHYGKVKGLKIVSRNQISEIPSDRVETYVRFEIDQWKELKEPIKPLHYGVYDRMYTTLSLLLAAKELPELSLESEEEQRLWKELRRYSEKTRAVANNKNLDEARVQDILIGDSSIKITKNNIICQKDDQKLIKSLEDLRSKRIESFKEIKRFLISV